MLLTRVKLSNFCGFESFAMSLDPRLTVLVGRNGSGKSSLLRAIEIAASHVVDQAMALSRYGIQLKTNDLRSGSTTGEIVTTWESDRQSRVSFGSEGGQIATTPSTSTGFAIAPLCIPLFTDRSRTSADRARGTSARLSVRSLHPAWDDIVNNSFLQFEHLLQWFHERENIENQIRLEDKDSFNRTDPALDAVRSAVTTVLGKGYGAPRIDRTQGPPAPLVLKKNGVQLSAEQLSDGERSQLLLAATLARRLFLLDPKASNPLDTAAIVLVDEIELHLHPAWQHEILATLLRTFPQVQFVVSTHSAPVLSTVKSESVRVLENFHAYTVNEPVIGRDANSILEDVLGVSSRPEWSVEKFREVTALIDQGDTDPNKLGEAALKLTTLEAMVGSNDPEVVRLRTMLEFLRGDSDEAHAAEDD